MFTTSAVVTEPAPEMFTTPAAFTSGSAVIDAAPPAAKLTCKATSPVEDRVPAPDSATTPLRFTSGSAAKVPEPDIFTDLWKNLSPEAARVPEPERADRPSTNCSVIPIPIYESHQPSLNTPICLY